MRKISLFLLAFLLLGLSASPAQAFSPARTVKFPCGYSHGPLAADPLVSPGVVSAHVHEFFGNETTNQDSTLVSMVGQPTTCNFTGDTAAYWIPALYHGDGTYIRPLRAVIYYDRTGSQQVTSFPAGVGSIIGFGRTPFNTQQRSYYGWVCDNRDPLQSSLANLDCSAYSQANRYISARLFFPWCSDGTTLTYPAGYPSSSTCPVGTQATPRLREIFKWPVSVCKDCYLSSDAGMATSHGASLHADFWNTWTATGLAQLVAQLDA